MRRVCARDLKVRSDELFLVTLLPTAAKRSIQLHYREALGQAQLCQPEFTREKSTLRVQYLQVTVKTAFIPQIRQPNRVLQGFNELLLLIALFANPPIPNE